MALLSNLTAAILDRRFCFWRRNEYNQSQEISNSWTVSSSVTVTEREERYQPIIQVLKQQFGPRLRSVVLFGSRARGEARPDSDHDLFVVIDQLPIEPVARQRLVRIVLLDILGELPGTVNFITKTPEEVAANLTPLLLDICVDGICLFGEKYFEPYRQKALIALQ